MQQTFPSFHIRNILRHIYLNHMFIFCGIVYCTFTLFTFPKWTVDDAYISFRYAYNLAMHGDLNWNVGYDPVEGYTGVLLPLLLTPVIAFAGSPVGASQVIGLLSFMASAVLFWCILKKLGAHPILRDLLQMLFLITPAFYTHVFSGLETMLFIALILASLYVLLQRRDILLPLLLLFTSLTRPEGALLTMLFIGVRMLQIRHQSGRILNFFFKFTILYILPGLSYFIWRWSYYGHLLPNTFYVKVNGIANELEGINWFNDYLLLPAIAVLLTLPLLSRMKHYALEYSALVVFIGILFTLYSQSMLVVNYGHRFYMPFYPLILIILAMLINTEGRTFRQLLFPLIPLTAQITLCLTVLLEKEVNWITEYKNLLENEHVATAEFIKTHVPANEWIILNDTGVIPYLTQLKTVDSGALNDEFLAHVDDPVAIRNYLNSFHAAAITIPWIHAYDVQGLDPYNHITNPTDYQLITDYKDPQWLATYKDYRVYLFLRKDLIK